MVGDWGGRRLKKGDLWQLCLEERSVTMCEGWWDRVAKERRKESEKYEV